jgi:hypothetical protein
LSKNHVNNFVLKNDNKKTKKDENKFIKIGFSIFTLTLYLFPAFGQSPEKVSYQAVIRDASDNLVKSQTVGMQISILQGSTSVTTKIIFKKA